MDAFRIADDVVRAARAESALCAQRLPRLWIRARCCRRFSHDSLTHREREHSDTRMLLLAIILTCANGGDAAGGLTAVSLPTA